MEISNMFGRFFSKRNSGTEPASEDTEQTQENFNNFTSEKFKAVILSLQNAEPIFSEAGYLMTQLDVEFGNNPNLSPQFKKVKPISEQKYQSLIDSLKDQQLIKFIIISLHKSSRMQSLFDDSNFYYFGMEIDISSIPSVRTIFKRKEKETEVLQITPNKF